MVILVFLYNCNKTLANKNWNVYAGITNLR